MISTEQIKNLRQKTNLSVMECKSALSEAKGDEKKALQILSKKGAEKAIKKSEREAKQGLVESYIHNNGKIGVILELNCETDFVARNEDFKKLAHDLTMHIAALEPKDEKELLKQPFIKDESKIVGDLITEAIAKLGENIKVGKFVRLEI
ncbi:MAG: translation elongation factor Ts [Candidatus Portnoybacteria bacterium]